MLRRFQLWTKQKIYPVKKKKKLIGFLFFFILHLGALSFQHIKYKLL